MSYVVLDFETTGLDFRKEQVIEIAAIKLDGSMNEVGSINTFVKLRKGEELPEFITELTGIGYDDLIYGMDETKAFKMLSDFIGTSTVVAQHAPFDLSFLNVQGIKPSSYICTRSLSSLAEPHESASLGKVCERLDISLENAHRAMDDARATAKVFSVRMQQVREEDIYGTLVVSGDRPLNFIPDNTKKILLKEGGVIVNFDVGIGHERFDDDHTKVNGIATDDRSDCIGV